MAVGNPYTEVSIVNYNVTPPTDDGAQTAANTVEWAKHKDKLADPIKTLAESTQTAITSALDKRLLNAISGKTGNYTVLVADRGKVINFTGSSAATFTLPAAADAKVGFELVVRNFGTAVLTVDGSASETIDGLTSIDLYEGQNIFLQCDGTNWASVSRFLKPGVLAKTNADSPYTVLVDDEGRMVDVDASGGAVTINLPAAATAKNGFSLIVKKTDSSSNAVTIDGDGSETIDGETTKVLSDQYESVTLVCDGSEWFLANVTTAASFQEFGPTATTSGTSVTVSSIPAAAKAIHILIDQVSLDGTTGVLAVRLGDSGGIETTGYDGSTSGVSDRWQISASLSGAGEVFAGIMEIRKTSADVWVTKGIVVARIQGGTPVTTDHAGVKTLSGTLTQVQLLVALGNNFDAGQILVQVEV